MSYLLDFIYAPEMLQAVSYVRENIFDRSYNSYRAHKDNFGVNNE